MPSRNNSETRQGSHISLDKLAALQGFVQQSQAIVEEAQRAAELAAEQGKDARTKPERPFILTCSHGAAAAMAEAGAPPLEAPHSPATPGSATTSPCKHANPRTVTASPTQGTQGAKLLTQSWDVSTGGGTDPAGQDRYKQLRLLLAAPPGGTQTAQSTPGAQAVVAAEQLRTSLVASTGSAEGTGRLSSTGLSSYVASPMANRQSTSRSSHARVSESGTSLTALAAAANNHTAPNSGTNSPAATARSGTRAGPPLPRRTSGASGSNSPTAPARFRPAALGLRASESQLASCPGAISTQTSRTQRAAAATPNSPLRSLPPGAPPVAREQVPLASEPVRGPAGSVVGAPRARLSSSGGGSLLGGLVDTRASLQLQQQLAQSPLRRISTAGDAKAPQPAQSRASTSQFGAHSSTNTSATDAPPATAPAPAEDATAEPTEECNNSNDNGQNNDQERQSNNGSCPWRPENNPLGHFVDATGLLVGGDGGWKKLNFSTTGSVAARLDNVTAKLHAEAQEGRTNLKSALQVKSAALPDACAGESTSLRFQTVAGAVVNSWTNGSEASGMGPLGSTVNATNLPGTTIKSKYQFKKQPATAGGKAGSKAGSGKLGRDADSSAAGQDGAATSTAAADTEGVPADAASLVRQSFGEAVYKTTGLDRKGRGMGFRPDITDPVGSSETAAPADAAVKAVAASAAKWLHATRAHKAGAAGAAGALQVDSERTSAQRASASALGVNAFPNIAQWKEEQAREVKAAEEEAARTTPKTGLAAAAQIIRQAAAAAALTQDTDTANTPGTAIGATVTASNAMATAGGGTLRISTAGLGTGAVATTSMVRAGTATATGPATAASAASNAMATTGGGTLRISTGTSASAASSTTASLGTGTLPHNANTAGSATLRTGFGATSTTAASSSAGGGASPGVETSTERSSPFRLGSVKKRMSEGGNVPVTTGGSAAGSLLSPRPPAGGPKPSGDAMVESARARAAQQMRDKQFQSMMQRIQKTVK